MYVRELSEKIYESRYSNRLAAAIVVAINTPQVSVAQSTSSANGQQEIEEMCFWCFKTTKAETLPIQ